METTFRDSWDRKRWLDVCSTHQDAYKWDWDELASVTDWCLFTQERNFRDVSKEGLLSVAKHGLTVLGCNQTEIAVSFMMDEERYRTSISSTKLEFLEEHLCNIPYWIVFGQGYLREMDLSDVDDSSSVGTSFDHTEPLEWEVNLGLDTGRIASKLALAQPDVSFESKRTTHESTEPFFKPETSAQSLFSLPLQFGSDLALSNTSTIYQESSTHAKISDRLESLICFALREYPDENDVLRSSHPSVPQPADPSPRRDPDRTMSLIHGITPKRRRKNSLSQDAPYGRRNTPKDKSTVRVKLTEEQRRQNHNESEQRRRTIIGKNLAMIRDLVPALIDTKPSQTTVILKTCEFLHDLVEGNKKLEQNLGPELAGPGPSKTSGE